MDSFVLSPFRIVRENFASLLVPTIPILFILAFFVFGAGIDTPSEILSKTDTYLGGTLYLSAANLTAFNDLSTNVQIPIIRLGGIADSTTIQDAMEGAGADFILVFVTLFLGFISYAMISNMVFSAKIGRRSILGLGGINPSSIILSLVAAFLIVFISSFSLAGFKLLLMITFGIYFTFSIPYASAGETIGESIYKGFKFISTNMGKVASAYIVCMGAAIMVPIGLLIFTTPLLLNLNSESVTAIFKLFLGLFSITFALFYQMALCSMAVFAKDHSKN